MYNKVKTISLICMIILSVTVITGCNSGTSNESPSNEEQSVNNTSTVADTSVDSNDNSAVNTSETTDSSETNDGSAGDAVSGSKNNGENTTNSVLDSSLTDVALLKALTMSMPDSLMTKTESTAADGSISIGITYTQGDNFRTEHEDVAMGLVVMIYNANEGMTYTCYMDQGTGIKFSDNDGEEDMNMGMPETTMMMDDSGSMDSLFSDEEMMNIKATVEEFNDEQVIHMIMDYSDDSYSMMIHQWMLTDYYLILKSETYMNEELIASTVTTDYKINPNLDDGIFDAPEGIEFMETGW